MNIENLDYAWIYERYVDIIPKDFRDKYIDATAPKRKRELIADSIILMSGLAYLNKHNDDSEKEQINIITFSDKEAFDFIEADKTVHNICVKRKDKGKPYIENIHFNISHSGELIVCGISDMEIGVDVEKITSKNKSKIISKYFADEKELIKSDLDFARAWTAKEALGKLTGRGIVDVLYGKGQNEEADFFGGIIMKEYYYSVCKRRRA